MVDFRTEKVGRLGSETEVCCDDCEQVSGIKNVISSTMISMQMQMLL